MFPYAAVHVNSLFGIAQAGAKRKKRQSIILKYNIFSAFAVDQMKQNADVKSLSDGKAANVWTSVKAF